MTTTTTRQTRESLDITQRSLTFQFEMMAAKARLELVKQDVASVINKLAQDQHAKRAS